MAHMWANKNLERSLWPDLEQSCTVLHQVVRFEVFKWVFTLGTKLHSQAREPINVCKILFFPFLTACPARAPFQGRDTQAGLAKARLLSLSPSNAWDDLGFKLLPAAWSFDIDQSFS